MTRPDDEFDVVVVGAGSSGATLAARLSESAGRRVLLIEAGPDRIDGEWPSRLLDPEHLPAADDPFVVRTPVPVGPGDRAVELVRGQVVGGSSAVNGAYFVRPTRADLDGWASLGNELWAHDLVLPALRRLESDAEFGEGPLHGASGPVPVTRRADPTHPVTEAFFAAAAAADHPQSPDLNGGGGWGWGPVPRNVDARGRVSTAMAYLDPVRSRRNLELRADRRARRVVVERGRAVGVEVVSSDRTTSLVRAATVVLSAGAVGSPALLRRSGIGPAEELRAAGTVVVVDAPGVGGAGSNHPAIDLLYEPRRELDVRVGPLLQGALHLTTPSGAPVEVLAMCRSYGSATGDASGDPTLSLRVSPMAGGPTQLRQAVREVTELAGSNAFSSLVARWLGPDRITCRDDADLDAWIDARVGTSMHLCSTAPMGPDTDPGAVVDQWGRVRGVEGLRVVDTSILPTAPTRGPACAAVMIAEHLASTFG